MNANRFIVAASLFLVSAALCEGAASAVSAQETVKADAVAPKELPKPGPDGWISLWDGKTLNNWKTSDFFKPGKVRVDPNFKGTPVVIVDAGTPLNGFNWTGAALPKTNYEIDLEAMKIDGDDFMCGLTFPVGNSFATLVMGGWGGYTTGISSLDSMDASENETQCSVEYVKERWYHVRMRVTAGLLQTWLNDKKIIDVKITGRKVGLRFGEIDKSCPLGIATYKTTAAYRNIKIRKLTPKDLETPPAPPTSKP
jgi:Domain of Unknown Function (DUF1080)